jgi:endoglucanase
MPKIIAGARLDRDAPCSASGNPLAFGNRSRLGQSLGEFVDQLIRITANFMSPFHPLKRLGRALLLLTLLSWVVSAAAQVVDWPLWESFRRQAIQSDGRVIERRANDRTTSEAQAYALFFALVANDRGQFERLLSWTQNNLAHGDLRKQQPAWLWGTDTTSRWRVLDANPAADADFWLAYTLLQAGRLWQVPDYSATGRALLQQILASQQVELPGFGMTVLPGRHGFVLDKSRWRINPSYLMPQHLRAFAQADPAGPWQTMADNLPMLIRRASPAGFVPDWIVYQADKGWVTDPVTGPIGSYDAIRVYLWLGMMDEADPSRSALLQAASGMRRALQNSQDSLEIINTVTGVTRGKTPAGFTAALLPYLGASQQSQVRECMRQQILATQQKAFFSAQSLYYDQVLALFSLGFMEHRFRFDAQGALIPSWASESVRSR